MKAQVLFLTAHHKERLTINKNIIDYSNNFRGKTLKSKTGSKLTFQVYSHLKDQVK
jgi:hypothetical protein